MRSYARLSQFALLAMAGLILGNGRPFYSQSAARSKAPAGALLLGTSPPSPSRRGVAVVGPTTCPAGAPGSANCTEITVSCPGLPDLNATLGVAIPTAKPIGTIILYAGGAGTSFLDSGFPDIYLGDGFNVVQIAWASDWASANGAGVKSAACRPATVFDYVFHVVQQSSRSIGFCGQGASGGGAALGYALAYYGLSGEFDYVVIAAGPGVSRMDYGCDPPLYTGPPRNLCPLLTDAPFAYSSGDADKVNTWEGTTTCGTSDPPQNDIDRWAADSVVSPGADYEYPRTAMSWFFCVTQPGVNESTGQGSFLIQQVVPRNDPPDVNCYSGICQGEAVWQDPNAFSTTVSEMLAQCQANH
jgi:hypothetical protein